MVCGRQVRRTKKAGGWVALIRRQTVLPPMLTEGEGVTGASAPPVF